MRVALYIRMSTDKQEDSPERQKGLIQPYCASKNYEVVETYEDLGARGWDATRPEFLRMLDDARKGRFQLIVVDEFSRFSRLGTYEFTRHVVPILQDAGVHVETVDDGRRYTWNEDDLEQALLLLLGQHKSSQESKTLSRRTATGQFRKAKDGRLFTAHQKFGYKFKLDEKGKRCGYEVIPDQAEIVRRIFDDYLNRCMSVSDIVGGLNADGVHSPAGKPKWGKTTVHRILRDPIYAGRFVWGKVLQGKFYRVVNGEVVRHTGKKSHNRQRREGWIEGPGTHEAIVPLETFEEAQGRLGANQRRTSPSRQKAAYSLSQLMKCSHCGATMHGTDVKGVRSYRCGSYMSHGECFPLTVNQEMIVRVIVRELQSRYLDPAVLDRLRSELLKQQSGDTTQRESDGLRKRISVLDTKIEKAESRLAGIEDEFFEALKRQIRELIRERDSARVRLAGLASKKTPAADLDDLVDRIKLLPQLVKSGNPVALQEFFRSVIAGVELHFDVKEARYARRPLLGGTIQVKRCVEQSPSCPEAALRSCRCTFRSATGCNCSSGAGRPDNRTDTG